LYCRENAGSAGEELAGRMLDSGCFQVAKTPLGKPYFPKAKELHFSISHSGDYWVCAFAPQEVGVDIQEHTLNRSETRQEAMVRFAKMARRFFHPVEAKYVEKESFYRFFGVWAARESYVKYTGQGIDAAFSEHCVIPEEEEQWPKNVSLGQETGESWHAQGAWFWETVFEENYTLCVCAGEEIPCRVINCFEGTFCEGTDRKVPFVCSFLYLA
jgi:phosphopantetheinyl transferase